MQMNETNSGASCPERNCVLAPHLWPRHLSLAEVLNRTGRKSFIGPAIKRGIIVASMKIATFEYCFAEIMERKHYNKQTGSVVGAKMFGSSCEKVTNMMNTQVSPPFDYNGR